MTKAGARADLVTISIISTGAPSSDARIRAEKLYQHSSRFRQAPHLRQINLSRGSFAALVYLVEKMDKSDGNRLRLSFQYKTTGEMMHIWQLCEFMQLDVQGGRSVITHDLRERLRTEIVTPDTMQATFEVFREYRYAQRRGRGAPYWAMVNKYTDDYYYGRYTEELNRWFIGFWCTRVELGIDIGRRIDYLDMKEAQHEEREQMCKSRKRMSKLRPQKAESRPRQSW